MIDLVNYFEKQKRIERNFYGYADSIGWADLFNGLSGKTDSKYKPENLLPFPSEIKRNSEEDQILAPDTIAVIRKLIKTNKLRASVVTLLSPLMDEIVTKGA